MFKKKINQIQHHHFSQNIFETILPINKKLFNQIKNYKIKRDTELATTYQNNLNENLIEEIKNYLNNYILQVGNILNKKFYNLKGVWIQKYKIADYHNLHFHTISINSYSFVLYIDCGNNSGSTRFFNIGYPYLCLDQYESKPMIGKCIIFLGALPHESIPSKDNKKIIVSGNISYNDL